MARFRFPFEGLLAARRAEERQRQIAVAAVERERLALEQRLRQQQAVVASSRVQMRGVLVGTVDTRALRLHAASSLQQLRQGQRLALELAGVHRRLELARDSLVEATRDRRAIELLRERRLAQWRAEQDKAEARAMDELAVIAAARTARQTRGRND